MNLPFSALESVNVLTGNELLAVSQNDDGDSLKSKKLDINLLGDFIERRGKRTESYKSGFDTSVDFLGGKYWKSGVIIDGASPLTAVNSYLDDVPLDSGGSPLVYTLNTILDYSGRDVVIHVLLTVFGEISKFRNVITDEIRSGTSPAFSLTYWF